MRSFVNSRHAFGISLFLVAIVFAFSGVAKMLDVFNFQETLKRQGFPEFIALFSSLIPPIEVLIALGLALNIQRRFFLWLSLSLTILFSVYLSWLAFAGDARDCGCFGNVPFLSLSPELSLIKNALLTIAILHSLWELKREPIGLEVSARHVLFFACSVLAFFVSGISSQTALVDFSKRVETSESQSSGKLSTPIVYSQSVIARVSPLNPDSTYLLFVYNPNCHHCQMSVENVKSFLRTKRVDKIIGISSASETEIERFSSGFDLGFATIRASESQMRRFAPTLPSAFIVQRDAIVRRYSGDIPPSYLSDF